MSYIYTRTTESDFIDAFDRMGREDQFSRAARRALFEYYSERADYIGPIELDPIAICCDWDEYGDILEAAAEYTYGGDEEVGDEESTLEWFREQTTVITGDGFVLLESF